MLKFRLGDIPIAVQPFFWVLAVVLGFVNDITGAGLAVWVAVVFISVLVHELGHAFTVRRLGYQPYVMLHSFGGVTSWHPAEELQPRPRVLTTLAGPFAGFALAGAAVLVLRYTAIGDGDSLQRDGFVWFAVVNVIWGIFNLIPVRGLDGGQALRAVLQIVSPKHGARVAELVYLVVGAAVIIWGLVNGYLILAVFVAIMTFGSYAPKSASPRRPVDQGPGVGPPRLGI